MKEQFNLIKNKTFKFMNSNDWQIVNSIFSEFKLTYFQKDVVCISLMFEDTIETAFKKLT